MKDRVLVFSPHDDDALIGCSSVLEGSTVVIVTDGSLGYSDLTQKEKIVETRMLEAERAYQFYGSKITRLEFPDMSLNQFECYMTREGTFGLYHYFIKIIRDERPDSIFIPNILDFHPDHKSVHRAALVSIKQASSSILPDLGESHSPTTVYQYEVWNQLTERDISNRTDLEKKQNALKCFESQEQILQEIQGLGSKEYFHLMDL